MIVIYRLTNIKTGQFYIGSTNNFNKRKRQHLYKLRHNKQANQKLQNSFNKYGEECFKFSIVEENIPKNLRNVYEQRWIDETKPDFNLILNVGEVHYPTPSKEIGRKISIANTGKKRPLMAVLIVAEKNRGRKASKETREKISKARIGKGTKGINGKILLNTSTGIYYESILEAAITVDYHPHHLGRMLSGKYSNHTDFVYAT